MIKGLDATQLLVWGLVLHLFVDWFLQNDWMATNKAQRRMRWQAIEVTEIQVEFESGNAREVKTGPPTGRVGSKGPWWDRHPAAYIHSFLHTLAPLLIFPWWAALIIGVAHFFIDLRSPLSWWKKTFRQTREGPFAIHVGVWSDQVAHIVVLALVALLVSVV